MTLSDTQLVILSSAAQRDDLRIALPERLRGGAAEKVLATLLGRDFIAIVPEEEIKADALGNDGVALSRYRITSAGLAAIGLGTVPIDQDDGASSSPKRDGVQPLPGSAGAKPPRLGSKLSQVISLLERADGASLIELTAATGWLPHTTRAALTGLRKRGLSLERRKNEDGTSIYLIAAREIA